MILYLTAETILRDVFIDYIEVELTSGETVSLNWDESGIDRFENGFCARYKGVCFGEYHANGKLDEIRGMRIREIGIYTEVEEAADITIKEMEFDDGGRTYEPEHLPYVTNTGRCDRT